MNPAQAVARNRRGVLLMLLSVLCFIINALLIRALGTFQAVDVWLLSLVRFVVGLGLVLILFRAGPKACQPRQLYLNRRLISRGVIGSLGVYGYYLTVVHLGAGRATFINNTYVVLGAVFAAFLLKEKITHLLVIGGALTLTGLALLTSILSGSTGVSAYDLLAITVAFASAYVVVTIRQLHAEGERTSTIFAAQCAYGLLLCVGPALIRWAPPEPMVWLLMFVSAISAGVGQILMTGAFRELPVGEGSLHQMLVPLGIAIGGVVLFNESFRTHEVVGAALILFGTTLPVARRSLDSVIAMAR